MSTTQKLTIQHLTEHCGLAIEYVDDLPPTVAGCLDPSPIPRYIAINRSLSPNEQVFTIAHEFGHFVLHHGTARRHYYSFFLDRHPDNPLLADLLAFLRRYARLRFNRDWEADAYAIIMLVRLGQTEALKTHLERHPENFWWVIYAAIAWNYLLLRKFPIYRFLTS